MWSLKEGGPIKDFEVGKEKKETAGSIDASLEASITASAM